MEHEDDCVTVAFVESGETKKFIYPAAVGTFLKLDNEKTAQEFTAYSDTLAHDAALARRDEVDRANAERQAAADLAKKLKKSAKKPAKKVISPPPEDDELSY